MEERGGLRRQRATAPCTSTTSGKVAVRDLRSRARGGCSVASPGAVLRRPVFSPDGRSRRRGRPERDAPGLAASTAPTEAPERAQGPPRRTVNAPGLQQRRQDCRARESDRTVPGIWNTARQASSASDARGHQDEPLRPPSSPRMALRCSAPSEDGRPPPVRRAHRRDAGGPPVRLKASCTTSRWSRGRKRRERSAREKWYSVFPCDGLRQPRTGSPGLALCASPARPLHRGGATAVPQPLPADPQRRVLLPPSSIRVW